MALSSLSVVSLPAVFTETGRVLYSYLTGLEVNVRPNNTNRLLQGNKELTAR